MMIKILVLMFTAVFANNIVFHGGMGAESCNSSSDNLRSAFKFSAPLAVTSGFSAALSWLVREYVITPFSLSYLRTVFYVAVMILCALAVSFSAGKLFPKIYGDGEGLCNWIITNFALLGVLIVLDSMQLNLGDSVLYALFSAVGFLVASIVFVGIKERLEISYIPKAFRGVPILLIATGIAALAFSGLANISFG